MKLLIFTLTVCLFLASNAEAKRFKALYKTPTYAAGCNNDILKRGYQMYLTPRALAGLIAITGLNYEKAADHFYPSSVTTEEILQRLNIMIELPASADLPYIRTSVIYPLLNKAFIYEPTKSGTQLQIERHYYGKWAAEEHLKAFWEIYVNNVENRGTAIANPNNINLDRRSLAKVPPLELADYLILSTFYPNEIMGSTESYSYFKDSLSYYAHFYPTTPSAVLARLKSYEQRGWLQREDDNPQNRAAGGSLYQFSLTLEGKQAIVMTEKFYIRMIGFWTLMIDKETEKQWFPRSR